MASSDNRASFSRLVRFFYQLERAECLKQVYATSDYSWLHKKCAEFP